MLRERLIRVAYLNPDLRPHALHLLTAMEFPNQEALKDYLHEHPHADKSNHWVSKSKVKPKEDEGTFFSGVKEFLEEHLGHAKHVHALVKQAPAHVQKFIADPKHREVIIAKGVEEAKKSPKKLLDKAIYLVKDEFNEKKVGLHAAGKVLSGKEITKEEKAALVESVRDIAVSVMLSVFAGGGLAAVGSGLVSGLAMGVAVRMFSDTVDKLTDIKDTATVSSKVVQYGLPVLKKLVHLGSEAENDTQEAIAALIVSEVLNRLSKGISDEDVTYALEHFKAE